MRFYFGLDLLIFSLIAFTSGVFSGVFLDKSLSAEKISNIERNPIFYGYSVDDFTLEESANAFSSAHPFLWLNSGAQLIVAGGIAKTVQGELPENSKWRDYYLNSNPRDTDLGRHPQNIFRLLTKTKFKDFSEEAHFRIIRDNLSESKNRNESNGVFLYARFIDENNSYYLGIRVDGMAIIKKKINGEYFTLAEKAYISGTAYDRKKNPSLLPRNELIGIRAQTVNKESGVNLRLFLRRPDEKDWNLFLEFTDTGSHGKPFEDMGQAGIRTDFMDVQFDDYKIEGR
ncbi:hypothetical protein HYT00_01235 [Candidatus Giovannonibacteria bacterium]|nr:hypothetical protein [Candidatus Giovannonibacteria bacterium]